MITPQSATTYFYIRCSTKLQDATLQISNLISMISPDEKYIVLQENQSAFKDNVKRPVYDELVRLVKNKKIKNLYVWAFDRLHRNYKRLQEFFLICKMSDCVIHSYNEKFLEDFRKMPPPYNEMFETFMTTLFGSMGEAESRLKSGRVKNSVVKKEGEITKSYKGNKWGRKNLSVQVINQVRALHGQGYSLREICKKVNVYDRNNNPRPISKSSVFSIVHKSYGSDLTENTMKKDETEKVKESVRESLN
ncbi:MAG: recombinase family protein [Bacteroidetes bacterium]|nr:recombinase family protein [Bacteroidota bacterium]